MIEPGKYLAKCVRAELGETKTGKPQVILEFEVVGDNAWAGMTITAYSFLTDAAMDRTLESLRYCGWTGNDINDLSGVMTNEVEIVVEEETYEGKTHSRVKWINRIGGSTGRGPLAPDKLAQVNARIRQRLAVVDQKVKAQKATTGGAPGAGDDNIPF
jgi:hypothetical protein